MRLNISIDPFIRSSPPLMTWLVRLPFYKRLDELVSHKWEESYLVIMEWLRYWLSALLRCVYQGQPFL